MTLADFFETIARIAGLLYVVSNMPATGFNLNMSQILQPPMEFAIIL